MLDLRCDQIQRI